VGERRELAKTLQLVVMIIQDKTYNIAFKRMFEFSTTTRDFYPLNMPRRGKLVTEVSLLQVIQNIQGEKRKQQRSQFENYFKD
jgi:hypothetical protein